MTSRGQEHIRKEGLKGWDVSPNPAPFLPSTSAYLYVETDLYTGQDEVMGGSNPVQLSL